jgi:hypothetical protein
LQNLPFLAEVDWLTCAALRLSSAEGVSALELVREFGRCPTVEQQRRKSENERGSRTLSRSALAAKPVERVHSAANLKVS